MARASAPEHRRPGRLLYGVVIGELVRPTVFALAVLTALLLIQDLLGYSDLVVNRGMGVASVAWIALYQTVPVISATLPFSMLLGSMAGLGRLGSDRELLAIEACGISPQRLIGPVMTFAAGVSLAAFAVSLYGAAWSARQLDAALEEIARRSPSAEVVAGVVQKFGDWRLEAQEVSPAGDELKSVLLWMPFIGETAFAKSGLISAAQDDVSLVLDDVTVILDPHGSTRMLQADRLATRLSRAGKKIKLSMRERLQRLSIPQLVELSGVATTGEEIKDRRKRRATTELHRRFAMPLAPLVFGLLVVPLFLGRAHFSRAGGIVMGLVATLAYYGLIQLGDGLIEGGRLGAAAGVWLPNGVMGAVAVAFALLLSRMSSFGRHTDRPEPKKKSSAKQQQSEAVEPPVERRSAGRLRLHERPLERYVAIRFVQTVLLCFGATLLGYFLVDLLERLDWFSLYAVTPYDLLLFYAGRLPLLASRVIPMALLIGTSLTVSLLAAHGEIGGMRACGISALRGLAPILVISAFIVPAFFAFENLVLPGTNSFYESTRRQIVSKSGRTYTMPSVWYRTKNFVYEAEDVDPQVGTASDLKVYEMSEDHQPISRTDASSARHVGAGMWRLVDPVRVEIGEGGIVRVDAGPYARLGGGLQANMNTRQMSIFDLRRQADELLAAKLDAKPFLVGYYARWAGPLACFLLPAVALFFALKGPPYPGASVTAAVSVVLAVSFVLLSGVSTSLGSGGVLSPMMAGWTPSLVTGALAAWLGWRVWRVR